MRDSGADSATAAADQEIRTGHGRAARRMFIVQFGVAALNLPITIVLARSLDASGLGQYQFLNRLFLISVTVVCAGYPHAIAWAAAQSKSTSVDRGVVEIVFKTSTIGGVSLTALSALGAYFAEAPSIRLAWILFGLCPLFNLASANVLNFLRGKLDPYGMGAIKISQTLTWFLGCASLAVFHVMSVATAAAAMLLSQVVGCAIGIVLLHRRSLITGSTVRLNRRAVSAFARRVYPGMALRDLNLYADQIVVGLVLSVSDLGLYAVAVSLTSALGMASGPITNTVQPLIQKGGPEKASLYIARSLSTAVLVIGIPAVILAATAGFLVPLIYGQRFAGSVGATQVLCLAAVLDAINACCYGILLGLGRPGASSVSTALGMLTSIMGWIVFLPTLGIYGAAVASVFSYGVVSVFMIASIAKASGTTSMSIVAGALRSTPDSVSDLLSMLTSILRRATGRMRG